MIDELAIDTCVDDASFDKAKHNPHQTIDDPRRKCVAIVVHNSKGEEGDYCTSNKAQRHPQ